MWVKHSLFFMIFLKSMKIKADINFVLSSPQEISLGNPNRLICIVHSRIYIITRVKGQYRYSRYFRDVIRWKLRHSGKYSPVLPGAIATAELFKYGSIKCKQTQKNFRKIYHTLSNSVFIFRFPKTWIH